MKSALILPIAAILIVSASSAVIYCPGILPVNDMILYQAQVACNMLQRDLNLNPNLPPTSGFQLYGDVFLAKYFL